MANNLVEKVTVVDLGKEFESPVDVTDPCYATDVWCRINGVKIKPGKYLCLAKTLDWDDQYTRLDGKRVDYHDHRVGTIGIFHVDEFPVLAASAAAGTLTKYPNWGTSTADNGKWFSELIGSIGVDAGLAGFFHDKPDYTDEQWSVFCSTIACGEAWVKEEGFFSSSGIGDGEYDVYGIPWTDESEATNSNSIKSSDHTFCALEIRFIEPEYFFSDEIEE